MPVTPLAASLKVEASKEVRVALWLLLWLKRRPGNTFRFFFTLFIALCERMGVTPSFSLTRLRT